MQDLILYIVLTLLCVVIYLLLNQRKHRDDNKNEEEITKLKDSLTNSINTMSTSFNALSKDVTRDMTHALTKVDEKVGFFNQQVDAINKSQVNFSRILAGVKQYGGLAEFSLAALLKDLLPAAQYIANVKMKPDETRDVVEFAVKLEDILCPIDSHWPIEKYKAIDEAYQEKNIRVAYGGMASIPKRAIYCEKTLLNSLMTEQIIDKAKEALEKDFKPISDMRASSKYRMEVAKNLLQKCFLEITQKKLIRVNS